MSEKINELLVNARKNKKLTRKELAEISGFKERTIASYERGERDPTKEYINFVENYFKIDIKSNTNQDNKFMAYYDTFETSVSYTLVKSEYQKIDKNNPILFFIFDESSFPDSMFLELFQNEEDENLSKMSLIKGLEFQHYKRFFMRNPLTIDNYFNYSLKERKTVNTTIIVKNNLFKDDYPLIDDDYLGLLFSAVITDKKVILKALSKNFNYNFDYLLDEIEEYKALVRLIDEEEVFSEDTQTYNEDEKEEIRNELKALDKAYDKVRLFKFEMSREDFKKLTIIATEL